MPANKNAGKHPSYKKRNMSEAARKKKQAYDKAFSAKPEQVKKRMESNNARRKAEANGKDIEDKDFDHAANGGKGGFVKTSTNRGRKEKSRLKKSE
jgi:hypothetical protein